MKSSIFASMLACALAAPAFAGQYFFPLEKVPELAPELDAKMKSDPGFAQRIRELNLFPSNDVVYKRSEETITWDLPELLLGQETTITMGRQSGSGDTGIFVDAGGKGFATCKSLLSKPECKFELNNLASNPANRQALVAKAYPNRPQDQLAVQAIGDVFSEQMPIGIAQNQVLLETNKWWRATYKVQGNDVKADICYYNINGRTIGHFRVGKKWSPNVPCGVCPDAGGSGFCGSIANLKIKIDFGSDAQKTTRQLSGVWTTDKLTNDSRAACKGGSNNCGQVEFNFAADRSFEGRYTFGTNELNGGSANPWTSGKPQ